MKYLGHIISEAGMKPDPEKNTAILKMEKPSNVKELKRYLGIQHILGSFVSKYQTRL